MFFCKNKKKCQKFSAANFQFLKLKKSLCIAWAIFPINSSGRIRFIKSLSYLRENGLYMAGSYKGK